MTVSLRLRDGRPASGAGLVLEAHMSHPGMAPVTARLEERSAGTYGAQVKLTMGGDWIFVLTGSLPGGARVGSSLDVRSVRAAQ